MSSSWSHSLAAEYFFPAQALTIAQHAQAKGSPGQPDCANGGQHQDGNTDNHLPGRNGGKTDTQGDRHWSSKREEAQSDCQGAVRVLDEEHNKDVWQPNGDGKQTHDLLTFTAFRHGGTDRCHQSADHDKSRHHHCDDDYDHFT